VRENWISGRRERFKEGEGEGGVERKVNLAGGRDKADN
jgi:hypothetical protein